MEWTSISHHQLFYCSPRDPTRVSTPRDLGVKVSFLKMMAQGAPLWKFCARTPRASKGGRRRKWMRSRAATETMWYIYVHVKIDDSSIVAGFICVFLEWSRRYSHFLERNTHHLCSCCNMATVAFLCSIQLVRQATASGSNAFWR